MDHGKSHTPLCWALAPLVVLVAGCADIAPSLKVPSFKSEAQSDGKVSAPEPSGPDGKVAGPPRTGERSEPLIRPKDIVKVAPRASVVLDKNCPDLVQPYKLMDNVSSLAVFYTKEWIVDAGKQFGSMFKGNSANASSGSDKIEASTKLAAKQLNWLPMKAEVLYGERLHKQETAILDRDSKIGKRYYPIADKMLEQILVGVDQAHDYEFKLFILKNSTRNAMARAGGFLYLDQGLLDNPSQESKAYFALAHEVAHVLQRHETKELQSTIVDSVSVKDDLAKIISNVRSTPSSILTHVKAEKNKFTRHHVDQELQADSCAARLLGAALPDNKALAASINAFLQDLSKPEPQAPLTPARSEQEKLSRSMHEIVDTPVRRHPNNDERQKNLQSIYREIEPGGSLKRQ